MANAGILISWEDSKIGREALGAELWIRSTAYYAAKVADGTLESFEPFVAHRHGGSRNGFVLLRGDGPQLDALKRSQEFVDITLQAIHCLTAFSVIDVYLGEGLVSLMGRWMEVVAKS
jgi:hypothetical protein